jgi:hypothetical protein
VSPSALVLLSIPRTLTRLLTRSAPASLSRLTYAIGARLSLFTLFQYA